MDAAAQVPVIGQYYHWDHLPGGLVFVPVQPSPIERAELTVRGVHTVAELRDRYTLCQGVRQ